MSDTDGVSKQGYLRGLLGSSGLGSQGQGSSNRNSVTNVTSLSQSQPESGNRVSDIGATGSLWLGTLRSELDQKASGETGFVVC